MFDRTPYWYHLALWVLGSRTGNEFSDREAEACKLLGTTERVRLSFTLQIALGLQMSVEQLRREAKQALGVWYGR